MFERVARPLPRLIIITLEEYDGIIYILPLGPSTPPRHFAVSDADTPRLTRSAVEDKE